jgi:Tfp pilus assembly protein PilO
VNPLGWKRDLRLWLPAAVLLLLGVAALAAYQLLLAEGAKAREVKVQRARLEYEQLSEQGDRAEALVRQARQNQRRLERLYSERFMTEEQRVTKVIAEVKELAQRAGLDPPRINYPDEAISSFGLVKRSIVFGVDGTYAALRRFINFLELTESFITLDEIRPSETSGSNSNRLSINLSVSTLFLDDGIDPAALARSQTAAGASR